MYLEQNTLNILKIMINICTRAGLSIGTIIKTSPSKNNHVVIILGNKYWPRIIFVFKVTF